MARNSKTRKTVPVAERISRKVIIDPDTGCFEWTGGYNNRTGYGKIKVDGKMQSVHRMAFLLRNGWVPERGSGYDIDHLCRNRKCCNPDHLEAVTHQENLIRGARAREIERLMQAKDRWVTIFVPEGLDLSGIPQ